MSILLIVLTLAILLGAALSIKVVKQYEQGVLFRLGRVLGAREPGLRVIIPFVDVLHRVSLRIITMPIQSQGIITRDNVSVDVSAVAYFRVVDAVKSVVAIENVHAAINQITLRKVVGQRTLDETLSLPEPSRSTGSGSSLLSLTCLFLGRATRGLGFRPRSETRRWARRRVVAPAEWHLGRPRLGLCRWRRRAR